MNNVAITRIHGFRAQLDEFVNFLKGLDEYEDEDLNPAAEAISHMEQTADELYYLLKDLKDGGE